MRLALPALVRASPSFSNTRHWRTLNGMCCDALGYTDVFSEKRGRLLHLREVWDASVGLIRQKVSHRWESIIRATSTHMVQIQRIDKVGHVLPTPLNHFIGADILVPPGCQPFLEEEDLGVMVGSFGEDPIATSPWRHHVEWNSDTCENRIYLSKLSIRILHPLAWSILGGVERHNVVSKTTRFYRELAKC